MLLSNIFSNKLDDFVNSSNNEDIISHCQKRNTISPQLLVTERNGVASHSKIEQGIVGRNKVTSYYRIEKEVIGRNRVTGHSEIEKRSVVKNRIAGHFEIEPRIEITNGDLSDVRFSIKK